MKSRFTHARASLRVEAFNLNSHRLHGVQNRLSKVGMYGSAQEAVSKHPRRKRHEVAVKLLPKRFGVLAEEAVFVFDGGVRRIPHGLGALDDAAQHLQRRDGQSAAVFVEEINEEERRIRFPRQHPETGELDSRHAVGITRMPTGHAGVVIQRVRAVPTKNNVTKSQTRTGGRIELLQGDV